MSDDYDVAIAGAGVLGLAHAWHLARRGDVRQPDMTHAPMRRCGIASANGVAKVGDTPADLIEGTHAGCALVIGVTNGTHTAAELAPHPHTHLVASLREVPALCRAGGLHRR